VNLEHGVEAAYSDEDEEDDDSHRDNTDGVKLLSDDQESPRRYHLRTCPALKLGEYSNNGNSHSGKSKDPVYFLLQRYEEEKEMCSCSGIRYMTLNTHEQKAKREKKRSQKKTGSRAGSNGGLYKSNSSPSLLLTSDNGSSIDPSELLDEEDYDLSDNEKDDVGELQTTERYPTLKRQKFKDSYDQFCRDGSTSKDSRNRLSSDEKTEVDKNIMELENGDIVNLKDVNDVSSENSATESERIMEKEENRRSKSSGFGDGSNSTSDSESIQELKNRPILARLPPYTNGYHTDTNIQRPPHRDYGYASDISTRSSPLDYKGIRANRYHPSPSHSQRLGSRPGYDTVPNYYSEDSESVRSLRPMQPPPYTQALHDMDRFSEKNDVTDSEEMYDHLLDMGRQLGVTLDDSIEMDLNTKGIVPPPTRSYSNPRAFPPPQTHGGLEAGYMTDNSIGKDRYTDREKSERCAQLLNEFKSSKSRNTINNTDTDNYDDDEGELPVQPPTLRSRSVMGNVTEFEEPRVPPVLRRSNSAGSSGVYKEWLV